MFALFYNLYYAMFVGNWNPKTINQILNAIQPPFNFIGQLLTSIFNDVSTPYTTFGTDVGNYAFEITAFVLALITSIGIVVMAVKGVKKAFGIFFGHIR